MCVCLLFVCHFYQLAPPPHKTVHVKVWTFSNIASTIPFGIATEYAKRILTSTTWMVEEKERTNGNFTHIADLMCDASRSYTHSLPQTNKTFSCCVFAQLIGANVQRCNLILLLVTTFRYWPLNNYRIRNLSFLRFLSVRTSLKCTISVMFDQIIKNILQDFDCSLHSGTEWCSTRNASIFFYL